MTNKTAIERFGEPNITGKGYLTSIELPYKMRLAWDPKSTISTMACHKAVAKNFTNVFNELLSGYGYDRLKQLGIDLYGGCFNYRKKRNGNVLSMHSWGVAIDLDPNRNQLKETKATARFARPEYRMMIDTFYRNGFISLGVEKNFDWMHFEIK